MAGIGHVVVGMERHGYKLSLRSVAAEGWVASFHDHAMTSAAGFAAAPTPWAAVQEAARAAIKKAPPGELR